MSDGADTKKEKKTATEDQNATDPQVVTGAYLACELSSSDKTSTLDAIGCNVMSNNQKVTASSQLNVKFYSEYQSKQSQPTQANSKSGYQALFMNPTAQTKSTRYISQMFSGLRMVKELTCDGNKLPCVAPLNEEQLMSLALPQDGQLVLTSDGVKAFKSSSCVLNADHYCNAYGDVFDAHAVTDKMDESAKKSCMSSFQSEFIDWIKEGLGVDITKVFESRIRAGSSSSALNRGGACVVRKQSTLLVGGQSSSGCYVSLIRTGSSEKVVIQKKSKVSDPSALEKKLAQFECSR